MVQVHPAAPAEGVVVQPEGGPFLVFAKFQARPNNKMNPIIRRVSVDGSEIERFVKSGLMPVCEGEHLETCILGMLSLCVMMMKPSVSNERLQEIIMDASGYLIAQMADPTNLKDAN